MAQKEDKLKILKEILGSPQRTGNEYLFQCPQPNCEQGKNKLSVNVNRGLFHCWICEWSGRSLYRVIKRFGTEAHKFKWKSYENNVDLSAFESKLFPADQTLKAITQKISLPEDFVSLTSKRLPNSARRPMKYLSERGIDRDTIIKWRLGYSPSDEKYGERIIVPSFGLKGSVNYFVGRTYSNNWFKYQNADAPKNVVFNHLHVDWDEPVIFVEGAFDAFKAGDNAIPLLGSNLRENSLLFKEVVRHDSTVFIALDPDAKKKQVKLINQLLEYDVEIYEVPIPVDGDVGDLTSEEFESLKKQARKIDRGNIFLYNILNKIKELRL